MRTPLHRSFWPLAALLLAGAPALASAGEAPSWVFFADRGLEGDELSAALDARASELTPRALERRRRVRHDRGVDVRDLAPSSAHVAAVLATGARLRSSSRWLNAISIDADPDQLAAVAELTAVARLRPVARRLAVASPLTPRSHAPLARVATPTRAAAGTGPGVAREQLEMLQIPMLHDECGLTGAGVIIGVQDSGFSLAHPALRNVHVVAARDFLNDDDIVADEPGDPNGQHNHGTMILSLLAGDDPGNYMGAAPGVSVILSKTEDRSVEAPFEEDRFVEGLEWVESMGADLFTSSLGYIDWYVAEDLDGATAVSTRAAAVAVEQGLIMFNSAGNNGPDPMTLLAPADADGLITVGAVDLDGVVAEFSSRGPTIDGRIKPDIAGPGHAIWVADPNSTDDYGQGDGTSLAAPLVAGAAALLLQARPDLDPTSMRELLRRSSSLADAPNNDLGWGLLDAALPLAELDADLDGVLLCGGDCDDSDPDVAPGLAERCDDGRDNDCNDLVDGDDPACGGTPPVDDGSSGDDPDTTGATDDGEPEVDPGPDADVGGQLPDVEGCACTTGRAPWPSALLLPWLLLGLRRRTAGA